MAKIKPRASADTAVAMQMRAGRAILGWSQDELAAASGVSKRSIADAEMGLRIPRSETLGRISAVFAEAGVEWVASGARYGLVRRYPEADGETGMTPSRRLTE